MSTNKTILVVDDDKKVRDLIAFRLKLLGHGVVTAGNGQEALTIAEESPPDLVILDVTMPGLDGVTVCSRLKKSQKLRNTPVLMLTAKSDADDLNRAIAAGADDYVVKPYDPAHLQTKILHYLDARFAGVADRNDG